MKMIHQKEQVLTLLRGHHNAETAVLVEDYPYGSLRCQIKYWVERATKGAAKGKERPVSMTSNPKKGNAWCVFDTLPGRRARILSHSSECEAVE